MKTMECQVIVILFFFVSNVKSHCVGTCYSGNIFPEPQDVFHGKHLQGYSYKNITTDNPVKCYSSCVQDCRCKACQMKDAKCELLDEDKTSKADDFKDEPGYVYFDLRQTMYQGASHLMPPGVSCYNGCCRSQPCLNGGTCVEHCDSPKEKFTCTCKGLFDGKICENQLRPASCGDIMRSQPVGKLPNNGQYVITRSDNSVQKTIYCVFEHPNRAWMLIESYAMSNIDTFRTVALHQNAFARKSNTPNWIEYRLNLNIIRYQRSKPTMFRFTCDFPYRSSLVPDYLFGYLSDYDIIGHGDVDAGCFKFAHINIKGHDFYNQTAKVYHMDDKYHFHMYTCNNECGFNAPKCENADEDYFGYYIPVLTTTVCTARDNSTNQFWLGEEM